MSDPIPVTVLGASGVVGQRFVARLAGHPQFELRHLAGSSRSAGKAYAEACTWRVPELYGSTPYAGRAAQVVVPTDVESAFAPVVFSALGTEAARTIEPAFARAGAAVFSNASAFRMAEDVPLLVPEVNPGHLDLVARQRTAAGTSGAILCNPNCTAAVLSVALAPLQARFGLEAVHVVSLQALSGAGHPGVASLDAQGNVVPWISTEEEKLAEETAKMFGALESDAGGVEAASFPISAACHRVPVVDGHTLAVAVRLGGEPSVAEVRAAFDAWDVGVRGGSIAGLHSAPARSLALHGATDRPQPRLDVDVGAGMTVHVGRVRPCAALEGGIQFAALGHNLERGAAGGSVLNAELALARGALEFATGAG